MSSSSVRANSDCAEKFEDLKEKKSYKYIIFKLNEHHNEIVVEKTSTSSEYGNFCADLPEKECRWAVYDLEFKNDDGSKRNEIIFYQWIPDSALIKDKMATASTKDALKLHFTGIAAEIQASDYSDLEYNSVLEIAARFIRA